jgi:two-component system chemotaxis response regulator CheB
LLLSQGALDPARGEAARKEGALEVLPRPPVESGQEVGALASRLRVLAGVKMFARRSTAATRPVTPMPLPTPGLVKVVAIGASTGGPQALGRLFKMLSSDFPWPILCVQHMSHGFLEGMVRWLRSQTSLGISVASRGERPLPGKVYFAPEDQHLRVRADGSLTVEPGDPIDGHRPSATVLLSSVAEVYGANAIGILLTGMGSDGARGLLRMAGAGATTMAQDEESSVVFGMPRQAIEMGAVKSLLPLSEIGEQLRVYAERGK